MRRPGLASLTVEGLAAHHDDALAWGAAMPTTGRQRQPPSTGNARPRIFALALALVGTVLALAVACSGDDDGDGSEPSPSTERTTTSSTTVTEGSDTTGAPSTSATTTGQEPGSVEDDVVSRYPGFWEARFEANSPPDADGQGLAEYATGGMLDQARGEAAENRRRGVEFREPDSPVDFRRIEVVEVSGDSATVQDCVVNDGLVVRSRDGSVVNDEVTTHSLQGEMRRVDGEWRLAESRLLQSWEGVAGCARAG